MEALRKRGVAAELVPDESAALARLVEVLPEGAEVMTAGSTTLEEIGFVRLLKSESHHWKNLKPAVLAETDPVKQRALRARAMVSEYFIGSVQAVTQSGTLLAVSAGGSQLAAYAFTAKNVVWVVGTHKIVRTLDEALDRVREYSLPLEDQRMKRLGAHGTFIGKMLIFEKERPDRTVRLIFVNKLLGF